MLAWLQHHIRREAFVTGTFAGVVPVRSVDGRTIGDGRRGPMVERLQELYGRLLQADVAARPPQGPRVAPELRRLPRAYGAAQALRLLAGVNNIGPTKCAGTSTGQTLCARPVEVERRWL